MPSRRSKNDCTEVDILAAREDIGIRRQYPLRPAIGILGNREQAENVVPETFLAAALESDGTFSRNSTRRTWLTDILNHKVCDQLRRTYRNRTLFEYMLLNHGEEPDSLTSASAGRRPRDPRTELESKELHEAITRALRELPCRMATVYQLYESEDWSGREICEALQISEQNLWMMLCRARQRLRESLSSWW